MLDAAQRLKIIARRKVYRMSCLGQNAPYRTHEARARFAACGRQTSLRLREGREPQDQHVCTHHAHARPSRQAVGNACADRAPFLSVQLRRTGRSEAFCEARPLGGKLVGRARCAARHELRLARVELEAVDARLFHHLAQPLLEPVARRVVRHVENGALALPPLDNLGLAVVPQHPDALLDALLVGLRVRVRKRDEPNSDAEALLMQRVDHRAGVREFAGVEDEIAVGRRPAVVDLHVRARVAVLDDLLGVLLDLRLVHAHLEARPRGPDGRTHHAQVGHGARALLRERLQDAAVGGAHVRVGREADGCVGAMTRVVRAGETECSVGRDAALDAIVVVVAAAGIVHAGIILGDALLELVARRRAGH
eukprot:1235826-Pleurochrysis_carterae.AAC.3